MDTVHGRHRAQLEWIDALQTSHVVPILTRIRTPLMMGVDAAMAAEIVLGRARIELVEPKRFGASDNANARQRNRGYDCAPPPTHRAIASPWIDNAVGKIQLEHDRPAMTGQPVLRLDLSCANDPDHELVGSRIVALGGIATAKLAPPRAQKRDSVGREGNHRSGTVNVFVNHITPRIGLLPDGQPRT